MQIDVYFFSHASNVRMGDFYCTSKRCGQWGHFIGLKKKIVLHRIIKLFPILSVFKIASSKLLYDIVQGKWVSVR